MTKLNCPAEEAIRALSGRWKLSILNAICDRPKHFGELRRSLGDITQKMLTQQLRQMERDGIIQRKVIGGNVPQVEYSLTPSGTKLRPIVAAIEAWGATRGQTVNRESALRIRQYCGTLGSMRSAQALIPPATFLTFV